MRTAALKRHLLVVGIALACLAGTAVVLLLHDDLLYQALFHLRAVRDKGELLRQAFLAYGHWAPLIFMGLQVMQVLIAPIPGEASGILGGYIFGAWPGFLYSSLGLTLGSWIAFGIGRVIWDIMPDRAMETRLYRRFNTLVSAGRFTIPFLLFLIPGMPKDALSYLLGFSRVPLAIFLFITGLGRMPGTLMLSLQGAEVQTANYRLLALLLGISLALGLAGFLYRRKLLAALLLCHRQKTRRNSRPPERNP
ncbi:MAG: hypothetical protein COX17_07125 [Deltaproteobacteria bacterium CG23_combo_of_CG06-09_8_20_14_all_60_8]|nr:MAG: hypothetical protein AUK28_02685 [Desulfobacterales bacterium CG2_30_60_27]PIP43409.1 MAG: hypothetical protein COX17_07125 [Deltaproteobacteria bacterium CG23_combo_of_CG06-09_8_20_14_all_60_8]